VVARVSVEGKKGSCLMDSVSVLQDDKILDIRCMTMCIQITLLYYMLKMVNFMLCVFYHTIKDK